MKNQIELPWIEAGYQLFSKEGPAGLKVDILARTVGISRSSFYHLFGDLDIFQEKLLMYHSEMASNVAESVKLCKNIEPDFLLMMIKYQDYFFFNRQLRIHRENVTFRKGFEDAISQIQKEASAIWSDMVGLEHKPEMARNIFRIAADILFHRITRETMNYEWLLGFLKEIKLLIKGMDKESK